MFGNNIMLFLEKCLEAAIDETAKRIKRTIYNIVINEGETEIPVSDETGIES